MLNSTLARFDPVRKLTRKAVPLLMAMRIVGFYAIWILLFKQFILTFTTYFLIPSKPGFQDITDTLGSNEITLIGVCALVFVSLMKFLYPLTMVTVDQIISSKKLKNEFRLGIVHGTVLSLGIVLAFVLNGQYRFLGFFIQFDEAPMEILNIAVRTLGLLALVYCEGFIFYEKIQKCLESYPRATQTLVIGITYCFIKYIQFDLGVMHLLTLFLISMVLSIKSTDSARFEEGAGFLTALLVIFHVIVSLPVLGNEFSGIFHVKYQAPQTFEAHDNYSVADRRRWRTIFQYRVPARFDNSYLKNAIEVPIPIIKIERDKKRKPT
jgi:hypothetical protein